LLKVGGIGAGRGERASCLKSAQPAVAHPINIVDGAALPPRGVGLFVTVP